MSTTSDQALGVILRQKDEGKPHVIYYARKTLNKTQKNCATIEKEMLRLFFHWTSLGHILLELL